MELPGYGILRKLMVDLQARSDLEKYEGKAGSARGAKRQPGKIPGEGSRLEAAFDGGSRHPVSVRTLSAESDQRDPVEASER